MDKSVLDDLPMNVPPRRIRRLSRASAAARTVKKDLGEAASVREDADPVTWDLAGWDLAGWDQEVLRGSCWSSSTRTATAGSMLRSEPLLARMHRRPPGVDQAREDLVGVGRVDQQACANRHRPVAR